MAAKKTLAKVDFTKGKLNETITANVAAEIKATNTQRDVWRSYVKLCSDGHMTPDHAPQLLLAIRAHKLALRKKNTDNRPLALPTKQRNYEARSILRMSMMKCWPAVFDNMKDMDVSEGGKGVSIDTLVTVSKWLRSRELGHDKTVAAAPSRDAMMKAIAATTKTKAGSKVTRKPNSTTASDVRNPEHSLAAVIRNAKGLVKWMDGAKGEQFIAAIVKAATSAMPMVKAEMKRQAAEAAAA